MRLLCFKRHLSISEAKTPNQDTLKQRHKASWLYNFTYLYSDYFAADHLITSVRAIHLGSQIASLNKRDDQNNDEDFGVSP